MNIPTFDTWAAKERPTAAKMNANIRDAGNFFKAPPRCKVRSTSTATVAVNSETAVTYDVETFDNDAIYDPATPDRLTIKTSGYYLITAVHSFSNASVTGHRRISIYIGALMIASNSVAAAATGNTYLEATALHFLVAGDIVQVKTIQSSAQALASGPTGGQPSLAVHFLSS